MVRKTILCLIFEFFVLSIFNVFVLAQPSPKDNIYPAAYLPRENNLTPPINIGGGSKLDGQKIYATLGQMRIMLQAMITGIDSQILRDIDSQTSDAPLKLSNCQVSTKENVDFSDCPTEEKTKLLKDSIDQAKILLSKVDEQLKGGPAKFNDKKFRFTSLDEMLNQLGLKNKFDESIISLAATTMISMAKTRQGKNFEYQADYNELQPLFAPGLPTPLGKSTVEALATFHVNRLGYLAENSLDKWAGKLAPINSCSAEKGTSNPKLTAFQDILTELSLSVKNKRGNRPSIETTHQFLSIFVTTYMNILDCKIFSFRIFKDDNLKDQSPVEQFFIVPNKSNNCTREDYKVLSRSQFVEYMRKSGRRDRTVNNIDFVSEGATREKSILSELKTDSIEKEDPFSFIFLNVSGYQIEELGEAITQIMNNESNGEKVVFSLDAENGHIKAQDQDGKEIDLSKLTEVSSSIPQKIKEYIKLYNGWIIPHRDSARARGLTRDVNDGVAVKGRLLHIFPVDALLSLGLANSQLVYIHPMLNKGPFAFTDDEIKKIDGLENLLGFISRINNLDDIIIILDSLMKGNKNFSINLMDLLGREKEFTPEEKEKVKKFFLELTRVLKGKQSKANQIIAYFPKEITLWDESANAMENFFLSFKGNVNRVELYPPFSFFEENEKLQYFKKLFDNVSFLGNGSFLQIDLLPSNMPPGKKELSKPFDFPVVKGGELKNLALHVPTLYTKESAENFSKSFPKLEFLKLGRIVRKSEGDQNPDADDIINLLLHEKIRSKDLSALHLFFQNGSLSFEELLTIIKQSPKLKYLIVDKIVGYQKGKNQFLELLRHPVLTQFDRIDGSDIPPEEIIEGLKSFINSNSSKKVIENLVIENLKFSPQGISKEKFCQELSKIKESEFFSSEKSIVIGGDPCGTDSINIKHFF